MNEVLSAYAEVMLAATLAVVYLLLFLCFFIGPMPYVHWASGRYDKDYRDVMLDRYGINAFIFLAFGWILYLPRDIAYACGWMLGMGGAGLMLACEWFFEVIQPLSSWEGRWANMLKFPIFLIGVIPGAIGGILLALGTALVLLAEQPELKDVPVSGYVGDDQ